jgi:flap endonuclease-1
MGNAALRDLASIEPVTFDEIGGAVVAVDAHNWLYRYLTTTVRWTRNEAYTTEDGTEVPNLLGIVQGLPRLLEHDLHPVFVFDGEVTDLKRAEIEDRREAKINAEKQAEAARARGDRIEAARYESRTQRLTETIQRTSRELFDLLDVPYVDAPAEGEAQAAHLVKLGIADYAGTEDYDALLYGSPLTLRGLTSKGDPECMYFDRTLESLEVTHEQLVDIAILCGTDFNEGLAGVGPKTALKEIREHGDLYAVLDAQGATIEHVEEIRSIFLDPDVTDEVAFDPDIDPDVEAARAYVTDRWGVPADEVDRGFERIEAALVQTGLDRWT